MDSKYLLSTKSQSTLGIYKIIVDAVFGHVSLDAYLGINEI